MELEKIKRIVQLRDYNEINEYLGHGWVIVLTFVQCQFIEGGASFQQIPFYHLGWTSDADPWYPQENYF